MGNIQIPAGVETFYFDDLPPILKKVGWMILFLLAVGFVILMFYSDGQSAMMVVLRVWPYPVGAIVLILLGRFMLQHSILTVPLALLLAVCGISTMAPPAEIAKGIEPEMLIIVLGYFVLVLESLALLAFIGLTMIFWWQGKLKS